jgi:Protein of unknown function (DUF2795)
MAPELAGRSTANVAHHLRGMAFPASKEDLVERARNGSAGQDVLEALECLPDEEFESLDDVLSAYEALDQDPQSGVIDKRP